MTTLALAGVSARLSVQDLLDDWRVALGATVGVAAVLAPLLLLLGIKDRYVAQLHNELTRFPTSRELLLLGQPDVRWSLVEEMRSRPDVAFAAPRTRFLSASALMRADGAPSGGGVVDLAPSGPGDPLPPLAGAQSPSSGGVVLSAAAARTAGVQAGDSVIMEIDRASGGAASDTAVLKVAGVLPEGVTARRIALIDEALLLAVEVYRESPETPSLAAAGGISDVRSRAYSGMRLYARTINDVASLHDALASKGFEVESRRADIALLDRIARGLASAFTIIASVAAIGGVASLAAFGWVMVDRKRPELAALRLMGLPGALLCLFPLTQAVIVGISGWAAAVLGVHALSALVSPSLADLPGLREEGVTPALAPVLLAGSATVILSALAASAGAFAALRVSPAEGLRDV